MQRTVTGPAMLASEALADLKGWLGITNSREDTLLVDCLAASLALCEAFTGQAPLEQGVKETVPALPGWHDLVSRPVRSLRGVDAMIDETNSTPLDPADYAIRIEPGGRARLHLVKTPESGAIVVTVRAGIAVEWAVLPSALKQGIVRLAAYNYRERDAPPARSGAPFPPASVAALWRPWRTMRLV